MSQTGDVIDRFELIERIGSGSYADVFRAVDSRLGRDVAIKVFRAPISDSLTKTRFEQEVNAAARLKHKNIITLLEASIFVETQYIVYELVEGVTLREWTNFVTPGRLEIASLLSKVSDALNYAHNEGIIHRDIKPENIIVDFSGTPFIADFGLAQIADKRVTEADISLGTIAYLAPEQCQDKEVDSRADIFSVGVVLFEILTQMLPFRAVSRAEYLAQLTIGKIPPVKTLDQSIPHDLAAICDRCLAKLPQNRYRDANELTNDLIRFCAGQPTLARPISMTEKTFRFLASHRWKAALTIATLLVISGLLVMLASYRNSAVDAAVQSIESADLKDVEPIIERSKPQVPLGALAEKIKLTLDASNSRRKQNRLILALHLLEQLGPNVLERLCENFPHSLDNAATIVNILNTETNRKNAIQELNRLFQSNPSMEIGIGLLLLGDPEPCSRFVQVDLNPAERENFILKLATTSLSSQQRLQTLQTQIEELKSACLLAAGDAPSIEKAAQKQLLATVKEIYTTTDSDLVRASARYCATKRAAGQFDWETIQTRGVQEKIGDRLLNLSKIPRRELVGLPQESLSTLQIKEDFLVSTTEITQTLYKEIMGKLPSQPKIGDELPVSQLSPLMAMEFCNRLSQLTNKTPYYTNIKRDGKEVFFETESSNSNGFRLPTREQWYWLTRSKSDTRYFYGDEFSNNQRLRYGVFFDDLDDSISGTQPVGHKRPNQFGVFDVYGNVAEIIHFDDSFRTIGGSYFSKAAHCNSTERGNIVRESATPKTVYGLRVVCPTTYE